MCMFYISSRTAFEAFPENVKQLRKATVLERRL